MRNKVFLAAAASWILSGLPWLAGTAHAGPPQLAQAAGDRDVVCDEIRQRHVVNRNQLDSRTINLLFFDAAERGCLDLVETFLELGASIEARDRSGNTGLLIAARRGENRVVKRLLDEGSDVNHRNLAGGTALLRAVTMNRRGTAKMLLQAGAEPNQENNRGVLPLTAAAFNGNDRLVELLLETGVEHDVIDATGKGPMVYAAAKGFTGIVGMLLDAGVEADARYGHELTALMWAAGHSNDVPVAEGVATVGLLLDRGARHDPTDDRGRTALMTAAQRGHAEIVSLLLAAGADPLAKDLEGLSATELAADDEVRLALEGG